jgi:mannan endo-1,4-beta-mannosidase
MKLLPGALCLSILASSALAVPPSEPANTNASAETRALLAYFQGISGDPAKHIVSGQFANFGMSANLRMANSIAQKTGHWPAIIGVDYADFSTGGFDMRNPNQTAIAYWRKGGLVTVSAHLYNPARTGAGGLDPKNRGLNDKGVDLATLLDPQSETHHRWMTEMDRLGDGLKELDDAGVVVLWRPFHEMNGNWFWWGDKDPETFVKLWRKMFDYFTYTRGLNNLIWVYGPNHGWNAADYYPGDRYVDLVGLDAYTDNVDRAHIHGYADLAALPKPFGFSEFGPHDPQNPPGDFDYMRFLSGVTNNFPQTCFFMSWNRKWSLGENTNVKAMLDNPLIVNLAELPAHKTNAPAK